jgi:multimeric flavodoxin WrbA
VKLRRGRPPPDAFPGGREDRHGSVNGIIAKTRDADGIILGSPVYFSDIKPVRKALIDRSGRVCRAELKSILLVIGAQIPPGFEP